jgi:iron(III) transport system ATP-binding protein
MPGAVRHREFLGSQIRYLVDTPDGQIIVDTLHTVGDAAHAIGARVGLAVNTQGAPLLP